jgi:4-hydroxy-3-methylbut-2-enyl diphosphate reductase IspH
LSNTILHRTRNYSTTACATPNSKQSVTQQTLPYWHLVVAVCATSSSNSVTLRSVQQPLRHTMWHHQNALGKYMWLNAGKLGKG